MGLRRLLLALACAATAASLSGCFLEEEKEEGEPLREGLAVNVGGIEYTVFITRELNPSLPDDRGYWQGEEAKPGFALYGVFIEACNRSDDDDDLDRTAPTRPPTTSWSWTRRATSTSRSRSRRRTSSTTTPDRVEPGECIPPVGSLAQLGPTGGAMLPFLFPLEAGENRPLELEIHAGGRRGPRRAGPLVGERRLQHDPRRRRRRLAAGAVAHEQHRHGDLRVLHRRVGGEPGVGVRARRLLDVRPRRRSCPRARPCRSCPRRRSAPARPRCPCRSSRRRPSAARASARPCAR